MVTHVCVLWIISLTPPHQELEWNTFLTNQHQMVAMAEKGQLWGQSAVVVAAERVQLRVLQVGVVVKVGYLLETHFQLWSDGRGTQVCEIY